MSKKPDFSSFTPSKLNPKAARQLAEIDKIIGKATDKDKEKLIETGPICEAHEKGCHYNGEHQENRHLSLLR